jgi:hypothetical protein
VIEAWIDEVERYNFDIPYTLKKLVASARGAEAIAGPKPRAARREECVTFTLEGDLAREIDDSISGFVKPATKVLLFGLSFSMKEAAKNDSSSVVETGIGGEDHVRRSMFRADEFNIGNLPERAMKTSPLLDGSFARRSVQIACHPGIDDVRHIVMQWRTHQISPPIHN